MAFSICYSIESDRLSSVVSKNTFLTPDCIHRRFLGSLLTGRETEDNNTLTL